MIIRTSLLQSVDVQILWIRIFEILETLMRFYIFCEMVTLTGIEKGTRYNVLRITFKTKLLINFCLIPFERFAIVIGVNRKTTDLYIDVEGRVLPQF